MTAITIDNLSLKLSGLSEHEGERLAHLVAEGLGAASLPDEGSHRVETMNVNIPAHAGNDVDLLSKQIVQEVLRQLARSI